MVKRWRSLVQNRGRMPCFGTVEDSIEADGASIYGPRGDLLLEPLLDVLGIHGI